MKEKEKLNIQIENLENQRYSLGIRIKEKKKQLADLN